LGRRVAGLSLLRMSEICTALSFSFGCDAGLKVAKASPADWTHKQFAPKMVYNFT
jgi:hypothetical protein